MQITATGERKTDTGKKNLESVKRTQHQDDGNDTEQITVQRDPARDSNHTKIVHY